MSLRTTKIVKAADVVKQTSIRASVDSDIINANIILAQDSRLAYVLGSALMTKVKEVILDPSKDNADKRYEHLTEEYISPYLCWSTAYCLIPAISTSMGMGGVQTPESNQGSSVFEGSMSIIKQNVLNGASTYKTLLMDYLCANSSKYPEYSQPVQGKQKASDNGKPFHGIQFD